jgi:predicted PurR-regulated permease PerM
MNTDPPPPSPALEQKTFLVLLVVVTLAFGWILVPFYGAVFWGVVLAIVFAPLYRKLLARFNRSPNLAAIATLAIILLIVILPLALVTAALLREVAAFYGRIQSGELSFAHFFDQIVGALPGWVGRLLERFGLGDLGALQQKIAGGATAGSQAIAKQVLDIGQNTLDFVVSFFVTLYLAFFLLRDGAALARRIWTAVPLDPHSKRDLFRKFATVIRATVKGNILVAAAQGALGGLAFWYLDVHGAVLWAVLMAFLSLLPAVGAALIWLPVAGYLLLTGAVAKGIGLIVFGTVVIGLVDNLLRPVLVGKDIKMPDWMVLISTLGGMAIFGLNGFVIGPVVAAMFMSAWDIFVTARKAEEV